MSRGNERGKIFYDTADRLKFLSLLKDYHERYGILIHSFVLMNNHYHLIIETPKANLLKVMHGINGVYTVYYNRRHARIGHLFQGRYKAIVVDKDAYLMELSRYVHLNPVRAGITEKPEKYTWSSYPTYIGEKTGYEWIECAWILKQFGNNTTAARKKYRRYVEEAIVRGVENPMKAIFGQIVLGGEQFIEQIKNMVKGKHLSGEIVERTRMLKQVLPGEIIRMVAERYGVNENSICARDLRGNLPRRAAMYLVYKYTHLSNREAGKIFGGIHYSALRKAFVRFEEELATNKSLSGTITALESHVKT